jgi:hypothetical protein
MWSTSSARPNPRRLPAILFGGLHHQRWSIEEGFKRLKHRLCIEHVSGLTLLAAQQDFAARVLCDNLAAVFALAARETHTLRTSRAYVSTALKPLIPARLFGHACVVILQNVIKLIASQAFKHRPRLSRPRPDRPKPHKHMGYKAC